MFLAAAAVAGCALAGFAAMFGAHGIAGHTWDWGVPNFAEQFQAMAANHFSTWDAYFETGRYHYFKLELLYWLAITPFSVVGGEVMSKALPFVFVTASGLAMLPLARYLGLNWFWSALAGIFYALSPYTFSRVVAGHMPMLAGYALIPLLLRVFFAWVRTVREAGSLSAASVLGCGLLLGLTSLHPSVGVGSAVTLGLCWLFFLAKGPNRRKLTLGFALTLCLALLMNIHFMAPFLGDYLSRGAISHGWGLSASAKGEVTVDTELPMRERFHQSTSQPVESAVLLDLRPGMDTEYAFPAPRGLRPLWILASLTLACLALGAFAVRGARPEVPALYLVALVGVVLVCGSRTPMGWALYQGALKTFAPILFAAFSNTTRWLPLIVTAYAPLAFQLPQAWERDVSSKRRLALRAGLAAVVLVFVSPWLGQKLVAHAPKDSVPQPLAVKFTPIHSDDAAVYAFLRDQRSACRVSYLPPVGVSWPGDSPFSYEWTSAYSPKPFFLAFYNNPLGAEIMKTMFAPQPSDHLARLFGLASVKWLVYPHYDFFVSYQDFQPDYEGLPMVDGFKNYKPVLDRALALQQGLERVTRFSTVDLYYNTEACPEVMAGTKLLAVADVSDSGGNTVARVLPDLAGLPVWKQGQAMVSAGGDARFLGLLEGILGKNPERFFLASRRGNTQTVVYAGAEGSPPGLEFRRQSPTTCRVRLTGVREGFPLLFQETFHPGWKAYLVPVAKEAPPDAGALLEHYRVFPDNARDQADSEELAGYVRQGFVSTLGDGREKTRVTARYGPAGRVMGRDTTRFMVDFVSKRVRTSLQNDNLPQVPLGATWKEGSFVPASPSGSVDAPLDPSSWKVEGADRNLALAWPEILHWQANGYANLWWVDPNLLACLGDREWSYVRENPSGGVDLELILEFRPQRFYLLGLAVSACTAGLSLLALAGLGVAALARRRS